MAITKRIVCLANSRKLQGRCIAGKELVKGKPIGWIRPVSERPHEEVSKNERQYEDGSDPRVLDVIDVPLLEPRPKDYQQENWLLDANDYWVKVGCFSWTDLDILADKNVSLWMNGYHSYNGQNDQIPLDKAVELRNSLKLIHVDSLKLSVFKPGDLFGNPKRRVQARFRFAGSNYDLWITDPIIEKTYLSYRDDDYELGESFLTISLGEPYKGYCYKLVAAVISQRI